MELTKSRDSVEKENSVIFFSRKEYLFRCKRDEYLKKKLRAKMSRISSKYVIRDTHKWFENEEKPKKFMRKKKWKIDDYFLLHRFFFSCSSSRCHLCCSQIIFHIYFLLPHLMWTSFHWHLSSLTRIAAKFTNVSMKTNQNQNENINGCDSLLYVMLKIDVNDKLLWKAVKFAYLEM